MFKLIKILVGINKVNLIGLIILALAVPLGSIVTIFCALSVTSVIPALEGSLPVVCALTAIWMVLLGLFGVSVQKLTLTYIKEIEEKSQSSQKPDKADNK